MNWLCSSAIVYTPAFRIQLEIVRTAYVINNPLISSSQRALRVQML
jgi:hypothetical protein